MIHESIANQQQYYTCVFNWFCVFVFLYRFIFFVCFILDLLAVGSGSRRVEKYKQKEHKKKKKKKVN